MTTTTTYKAHELLPTLKAAAAKQFGEGKYLICRVNCGLTELLPPTFTSPWDETSKGFWFPLEDDEYQYTREGDKYVSRDGYDSFEAVANPGWPLTVSRDGRNYALESVAYGEARYVDEHHNVLRGRLTDTGLDVWSPAELAARPFPAIIGRNFLDERTLEEALADKGIAVKKTELGTARGLSILSRLEYEREGQPRVAYEVTEASGPDSWCSESVVLAEPVIPDERDRDWLYRLVTGRN